MPARVGRSQSRKARVVAALLAILLLTGIAFFAVSRGDPTVETEAVVLDHSTDLPLFTALPNASISIPAQPVYPYSVIPGGIASGKELATRVAQDPVVAKHYSGFNLSRAQIVRAPQGKLVYVAYRMHDKVFWTKKRLMIRKGEALVTDGIHYARARCGNRIADSPVPPTSNPEPSVTDLDPPWLPDPPTVTFPSVPSVTDSPIPALAPPSTGGSYFPPTPPIPFGPDSGPTPPTTSLPPGSHTPSGAVQPAPTSGPNVAPIPEPPTIWLASIGAACTLLRQLWRNRRKH
jgi:hypothetical protein